MTKRTTYNVVQNVNYASDLEELVVDKRECWRANSAKARRRQRRYKNRLTREFLKSF